MIDPTATHLPVLEQLFKTHHINTVLEFGCGLYSTTLFAERHCEFTSIEMQYKEWHDRISKLLPAADIRLCLGVSKWRTLELRDRYDLIFVDGHRDSRADCLVWAKDHTDLIVAHDTEHSAYGWDRADMTGFTAMVHFEIKPWTTVWVRE